MPSDPADASAGTPLVVRTDSYVATDRMLAHLPELTRLADGLETSFHELALVSLTTPHGPLRAAVDACEADAAELAEEARELHHGIALAEQGYALAESTITRALDATANLGAGMLANPAVLLLAASALFPAGLGLLLASRVDGLTPEQRGAVVSRFLLEHPELVTSPEFSAFVRRLVTGVDDAAFGAAGMPPGVALLLGEHGLGLLGTDTSAAALIAAGTLAGGRVFTETPVRVERTSETRIGAAPAGAQERLERVPDDAHVRIERYSAPGEDDRFVVYVAPTHSFSPVVGDEAFDLTSNIAGVGGLSAGSIRATEQAMVDAGITGDSEVVLVGFSQGGLVAGAIAGSERWTTVGLETYGDPAAGIELPEGIRGVAVRHTDDLVVATGGQPAPTDRITVERRAFAAGAEIPTDLPVPAHQRRSYLETAGLLDDAGSAAVRAELDALAAFTGDYTERDGSAITVLDYRAERVSDASR